MAKDSRPPEEQLLEHLQKITPQQSMPLQSSGKTVVGIFPSGAGGKALADLAQKQGLIEQSPTPTSSVPAKGKGKTKPTFRLTNAGVTWMKAKLGPKKQLEMLARSIDSFNPSNESSSGLQAVLQPVVDQVQQSMQLLIQTVERIEQSQANERRQMLTTLTEIKPTIASALVQADTIASSPAPHTSTTQTPSPSAGRDNNQLADDIVRFVQEYQQDRFADCPMHTLYPFVQSKAPNITIGEFHDLLRSLGRDRKIKLINWSGPLERMNQPELALFFGSAVMYYVSP